MKKRILSMLLLLAMLVSVVPMFSIPVAAAESTSKISVQFRLADARTPGFSGTLIAERQMDPGFATFTLPSDAECYAAGINPKDVFGWYHIRTDGTVIDAGAYIGTYITEDVVFYPITKESTFGCDANSNTPYFSSATNGAGRLDILGLRGNYSAGVTDENGKFTPFNLLPTSYIAYWEEAWSKGAMYYGTPSGGGSAYVLSANAQRVVSVKWKAIVSGTVDLEFSKFVFKNGAAGTPVANAVAYLAITKNGQVIWPAGATYASTGFEAKGWYKIELGNAEAITKNTTVTIPNATCSNLAVNADDEIVFHVGYGNLKTVDLTINTAYTSVGDLSEKIVKSLPAYSAPGVFSGSQIPSCADPSDTDPEITLNGVWDWITYSSVDKITLGESNSIAYYTKSDTTKNALLSSLKDYGAAGSMPAGFQYGLPEEGWGKRYSVAVQNGNVAGFAYTAEHTGYVDLSFAAFQRTVLGWEAGSQNIRAAIFVGGEMVWPNKAASADFANWYTPYPSGVTNSGAWAKNDDISAQVNATLPETVFVREGQRIEFLIGITSGSIWAGAGNYMEPVVNYSAAYVTDFTVSASLGEKFSINFAARNDTLSFTENDSLPYLLANSLTLELTNAPAGVTVGEQQSVTGGITRKVSDIDARMLNESITYALTATAKLPGGKTETVILSKGEISVADYLLKLAAVSDTPIADLANATVAYGREAQKFFNYDAENLPTAGEISFAPPAAEDVKTLTGSGDYNFTAATLLLQDELKLKLYIDAVAEGTTEQLFLKIAGSDVQIPVINRGETTDGKMRKAVFSIPCTKYNTAYVMQVVDAEGNPVSGTLTYSVGSYAARMQDTAALTEILTAIRTLGKAAENYVLATQPTAKGNVVSRFAVLSDAHIGESLTNANGKLQDTLGQLKEMGGMDAILFLGDMTNNGIDSEYDALVNIVEDPALKGASDRMCFVLGNHEHYRAGYKTSANTAEEKAAVTEAFNAKLSKFHTGELGFTTANNGLDHTLILNGTYFIGIGERDCMGLYGEEVEAYIRQQVVAAAEADPNKPIFIYSHLGAGAIEGSSKMSISTQTRDLLAQYPQVVWLTGHTHYAVQDVSMIQQADYTNIQCPTSGSKQWWVYSSGYTHPATYAYEAQQGLICTVSDTNVVTVQRYDFATGDPIGQEWVLDIPAIVRTTDNFTYRYADRKAEAAAPAWKNTDTLTVTDLTDTSMTVRVPRAHIDDAVSDDVVEYYRLVVVDPDGNAVYTSRMLSEYYRGTREASSYTFGVTGLKPETEYRVLAVAESIFGCISQSLETTVTTQEKIIVTLDNLTELLYVDYTGGSIADKHGHGAIVDSVDGDSAAYQDPGEGYPILSEDGITFDNSYGVGYNISDLKPSLTTGLTIETVVTMLDETYTTDVWGWVGVVTNEESGGFGLNYYYNDGNMLFTVNYTDAEGNNASSATVNAKVPEGEKVHIVATFDGKAVTIYINGVQAATVQVPEGSKIRHSTATDRLYIGANSWSGDGGQCPAHALVEYVTVYREGVTAGQAELMYTNYTEAE